MKPYNTFQRFFATISKSNQINQIKPQKFKKCKAGNIEDKVKL